MTNVLHKKINDDSMKKKNKDELSINSAREKEKESKSKMEINRKIETEPRACRLYFIRFSVRSRTSDVEKIVKMTQKNLRTNV